MSVHIYELLYIPIAMFETAITLLFTERQFDRAFRSGRTYVILYTSCFLFAAILPMFCKNFFIDSVLGLACFGVPLFFYRCETFLQRFCYEMILLAFYLLSDALTATAWSWIAGSTVRELMASEIFFINKMCVSLLLMGGIALTTTFYKRQVILVPPVYYVLLLVGVYGCTGSIMIAELDCLTVPASGYHVTAVLGVSAVAIGLVMVFRKANQYLGEERYAVTIERQIAQSEERFRQIDVYNQEIRRIRHDMTNILIGARELANRKNYAELSRYIEGYCVEANPVLTQMITGKPGMDAILSEKALIAEKAGIRVEIDAAPLGDIEISPMHLTIILGNAMDNAIEACNRLLREDNRYIRIAIWTADASLYFQIENSSPQVTDFEGGLPHTSKDDPLQHGFGLTTIKRLIDRYEGLLHCRFENGKFTFFRADDKYCGQPRENRKRPRRQ